MTMAGRNGPRWDDGMQPPAATAPITYCYASYEGGQHWFSAEDDGDEAGFAFTLERQGPGGPHIEIRKLQTNPYYRGRGIASRLLDNVSQHFSGREVRLNPYPTGESGDPDEDSLREFYGSRGFDDYQLKPGDPFTLFGYMTRPAAGPPAAAPDGSPSTRGREQGRGGPGDFPGQDTAPARPGRPQRGQAAASRRRPARTAAAGRRTQPGRRR